MTMGVGILTLPKLTSTFGILGGTFAIILGFLICLMSFRFIIYCCVKTEIKEFSTLVDTLLPKTISSIFKFTYFLDMQCFSMVYAIFGWKLFCYLLFINNLLKKEWIKNERTLDLFEYNFELSMVRVVYFVSLYVIMIPLLL